MQYITITIIIIIQDFTCNNAQRCGPGQGCGGTGEALLTEAARSLADALLDFGSERYPC